jgi:hypothetical protein
MSEQTKTGRPAPTASHRNASAGPDQPAPAAPQRVPVTCKILRVDLTTGKVSTEERDERYYRKWLGGSGIITEVLLRELPAGVDALGPENKLVFALSPITGTSVYATGRNGVGAKSPLSGGIALCQVGEYWGAELRKAGYDVLIVEGKADKPVYLRSKRTWHPRRRHLGMRTKRRRRPSGDLEMSGLGWP